MTNIQVVGTSFRDLPLDVSMYREAYSNENERGEPMTFSRFLETRDPSEQYAGDPILKDTDAFQRQLMAADILPTARPQDWVWAHKVERFWSSDKKNSAALFPEFIARTWRSVTFQGMAQGIMPTTQSQRFYMSSSPVSDVLYPDFIQTTVRQRQIAPAIPLSAVVAITTPIDQEVYRAFYLTDDEGERSMVRVPEGTPVPTAELTGGDHTITVKKYGRRLVGSYETFRRMRIDRFALHIALLAMQAEVDKVSTAIDVLVNGDGNSGTSATSSNLTTEDAGAIAGTPTVQAYLSWIMNWANPYMCNLVLARKAHILEMLMMNIGSANVTFGQIQGIFGVGGVYPLGSQGQLGSQVAYGWDNAVAAERWLGIDSRFALEMVTEIGASLTETDKIVSQQMNEIVMTESLGFAIFDAQANKILVLNA